MNCYLHSFVVGNASGSNNITSLSYTATGNALVCYDRKGSMFICKLPLITDPGKVHLKE